MSKNRTKTYDRVMPRVSSRSRSSLNSNSVLIRHEIPSSGRVSAKPSVSNVSSGVFSELPTVLNDYEAESSAKVVKKSVVRKPRKTVKSLHPAKSPPRMVPKLSELGEKRRGLRARGSSPSVYPRERERWVDSHLRQCHSSRSHTRLKELKDEIKAYAETEKLMKLRSSLYKRCGVVLDDVGDVAVDKAVQADDDRTGFSNEGKALLVQYETKGLLDDSARRRHCNAIINRELQEH